MQTKLKQSQKLWDERGNVEKSLHSSMGKFKDFWIEDFKDLTAIQKEIVATHYSLAEMIL